MQTFEYAVTDPVGLHARPAANLARAAANLASAVQVSNRETGKSADAKSMLAVMTLGIRTGDVAVFSITGETEVPDAQALKSFCEAEL